MNNLGNIQTDFSSSSDHGQREEENKKNYHMRLEDDGQLSTNRQRDTQLKKKKGKKEPSGDNSTEE